MYKARFKGWGFRKNISASESLLIQRQTYSGAGKLPVVYGHQLGSKRLKALVERASTQAPQTIRAPDCTYFLESALDAVFSYLGGEFDNKRWDFEALGNIHSDTVKLGGDLIGAAYQLGQKREIDRSFQVLNKCCAEFPAVLRKQDPLLVMVTYLGTLNLAHYGNKELAVSFIRYVTGMTEIHLGREHPLVQLWKSLQEMGLSQASQAVETIFRAQFDIFQQRVGLGNPLLHKSICSIVQCLNRLHLISFDYSASVFHAFIREFRDQPTSDAMLSGFHLNWTRLNYAAYLYFHNHHVQVEQVLDQVEQWHQAGGLVYNDSLVYDYLDMRADIREANGRFDEAEMYLKEELVAAIEGKSRISRARLRAAYGNLESFYHRRNRAKDAEEIRILSDAEQYHGQDDVHGAKLCLENRQSVVFCGIVWSKFRTGMHQH